MFIMTSPTDATPKKPRPLALSPSRAGDYQQCPLLYRFRAIDRLPEPKTVAQVKGTLVHAVLEYMHKLPRDQREYPAMVKQLKPTWAQMCEEDPELKELVSEDELYDFLVESRSLLRGYFEMENPQGFDATECEMYVDTVLPNGVQRRYMMLDRLDWVTVPGTEGTWPVVGNGTPSSSRPADPVVALPVRLTADGDAVLRQGGDDDDGEVLDLAVRVDSTGSAYSGELTATITGPGKQRRALQFVSGPGQDQPTRPVAVPVGGSVRQALTLRPEAPLVPGRYELVVSIGQAGAAGSGNAGSGNAGPANAVQEIAVFGLEVAGDGSLSLGSGALGSASLGSASLGQGPFGS